MKQGKKITISNTFKVLPDTHAINVSLAKEVGLVESIILQHFYFWHQCNKDNESMIKNGRVWFFRSISGFVETYKYLSTDQIRGCIDRLVDSGLVLKDNFFEDKMKKTSWYSLSDIVLELFGENTIAFGKIPNDLGKSQTKDNIIEYNKNKDKEIKKESDLELYSQFEAFAKEYKKRCGKKTVSSIKVLYEDFKKRHKDWQQVIPYLMPCLIKEDEERIRANATRTFYPAPKMLSTYLGKQRAWESFIDDVKLYNDNEYHPQCDGVSLFWNDISQCYITPFDIDNVTDGYTKFTRPNGAIVMWRGYRYKWCKEIMQWEVIQ